MYIVAKVVEHHSECLIGVKRIIVLLSKAEYMTKRTGLCAQLCTAFLAGVI